MYILKKNRTKIIYDFRLLLNEEDIKRAKEEDNKNERRDQDNKKKKRVNPTFCLYTLNRLSQPKSNKMNVLIFTFFFFL